MKSKIKFFASAFAILMTFACAISSCNKKTENMAPVVTLDEPADGESIMMTDSLHIEGVLSDDDALHEASILVIKTNGDTAFRQYPTVHDLKSYTFHYHFHPSSTGNYTLKVAAVDHDDASTEKSVAFSVN